MDAVILAGGFGTRLRPWTDTVPKPLIPLLDMTLIEHTIRILPRNTIQRVIIASGYGVDQMRAYFDNFDAGFEVIVVEEDQPLGTGGAIANCREHIRGPRAIVMNGDLITTVDVEEMLSQHVKSNALISISLWPVEDPTRFGVADFDHNEALIRRFQEKPRLEEAYSNLINAGCYILERSVIQGLSTEYHSMERDVFPGVAESGKMGGYRYSGRFIDAGTPTSYLEAMVAAIEDNSFISGGIVGTSWYADPKMSKKGIENSAVGLECKLGDGIRVNRSAILDGARIGENVYLDNCLIGRGSIVPANSHIVDTVIGYNQQYQ